MDILCKICQKKIGESTSKITDMICGDHSQDEINAVIPQPEPTPDEKFAQLPDDTKEQIIELLQEK